MSGAGDYRDVSFNPFSTRFVRPDQMQYRFASDIDPDELFRSLLDRFKSSPALAVIGPHGTGKSTLIHSLLRKIDAAGQEAGTGGVRVIRLSTSTKPVWPLEAIRMVQRRSLVVIDGFEQMPLVSRLAIVSRLHSGRSSARLLVTAHRRQWFIPTFFCTYWDVEVIRDLTAEKLLHLPIAKRKVMLQIANRLEQQHLANRKIAAETPANVRDYWFSLYDAYEKLRNESPVASGDVGNIA